MTRLLIPALAAIIALPVLLTASPAMAQAMPGMEMPTKPAAPTPSEPAQPPGDPHAGHAMPDAPGVPEAPGTLPAMDMTASDEPHEGHDMAEMQPETPDTENVPAPAPPTDHAADALFDPTEMARSRAALRREHGAFSGSMVLFDLAEYQARKGGDGYRWEGEAWFGGDLDRLLIKTEGEGAIGKPVEDVEVQALYSRAISPYWNAQVGVRHDIAPNPSRTYATIGIEGVAPYWFKVNGALFLSDKGDLLGRFEGYYDQRITQRLILQPRVELNFAAQDVPASGIGAGLSDAELGLRLRYEIRREFAPYIGVSWQRKTGDSARFANAAGERVQATSFVFGIRTWF